MQYVLTQEEYDALTKERALALKLKRDELQVLCTQIADTMPVNWGWGDPDPKPWQCIMSVKGEWYCDTCPVRGICPYEFKQWSK